MKELAERAVACKHWRWMPGMRLRSLRTHLRIVGVNTDGSLRLSWDDPDRPVEGDSYAAGDLSKATPDLTDPATLGCLLALVAEAYNLSLEDLCCVEHSYGWEVRQRRRARLTPDGGWTVDAAQIADDEYPTRAEALIAALEAAE